MGNFSIERLILEKPHLFSLAYLPKIGQMSENLLVGMHLTALRSSANGLRIAREALRDRKLKRLLSSAMTLAFWKKKIPEELFHTENPLALLSLLPVTTKAELKRTNMEERTLISVAKTHGIYTGTSGS